MITILLITIIPIALWGVYFYFRNPQKQPIWDIIKIFLIGTLSAFPVLLFHQFFLKPVTLYLSELFHLSEIAILPALLKLVLTLLFIAIFIFIFAFIQSTVLNIFYKSSWSENFKSIYNKMYHLTPLLIFFLAFIIVEICLQFTLKVDFILSTAGGFILFAVLEEYFKYMINPFLAYKRLHSIGSAIVNALYVGLAFAFIENILFFLSTRNNPDFLTIFVYRSVFTTLLHVCASGLLGYFYGMSIFSKSILTNYEIEKSEYNAFSWLRNLFGMKKKSIFQSISVTQGFFIVATLHAIFNLLIILDFKKLSAFLIIFFSMFIVYLLNLKSTQIKYSLVGTDAMPDEDYEQLRLKISVLQHVKEIQEGQNINKIP